jgi:hypothetical protein
MVGAVPIALGVCTFLHAATIGWGLFLDFVRLCTSPDKGQYEGKAMRNNSGQQGKK